PFCAEPLLCLQRGGTVLGSANFKVALRSRADLWACSGCKARNGAGYDFCWKCWKVRDSAKTTNHGATSTQDPDLAKHVQGNIDIVQKEVDELQAAVDNGSDIPRCFSECKLVRERNKTQAQRERTQERVEKLEEEIKEAQEKLEKEKALLARQDEKLQKQRARVEELS
ncbi:unnamed protein product, partial [Prorocentrum cordatum]